MIQRDATAETAIGATDFSHTVNYLSGSAVVNPSGLDGSSTYFLGFSSDGGIAGTRDLVAASQPADAKLSADRPFFGLYRTEILKSITAFSGTALEITFPERDHDGDLTGSTHDASTGITTTLVSRPFAGTAADGVEASATGVKTVVDATMAFDYGTYLLERFSNTCPIVRIQTGLEHLSVEIGDLVSVDSNIFLATELGLDGADSNVKFEVTQREVTPLGDSIGIEFELTYATHASAPSVTVTSKTPVAPTATPVRVPSGGFIAARSGTSNNAVIDNQALSFAVTTTSGLGISIAGGAVNASGHIIQNDASQALTMTASKDTYIGINPFTAGYYKQELSSGAAEPALGPGEVRLAKIVTDGSSVTSITDLRNFGQISIEQLDKTAFTPGRSLIWNAGFTTYPNNGATPPGWDVTTSTPGTDFIKEETVIRDGRYSIKTLGTSQVVRLVSEKIPVDKNRVYRASAFYRQAAAMNMRLFVFWWKQDKTASSTASTSVFNANLGSTGAFQNITGVVTPPSDCAYASLDLSSANTGVSYFNNADLTVESFSFSAKRTSSDFTPSASGDAVEFNTEIHDHGDIYNTSNGQVTIPISGLYTFSTNISFDGTSGSRFLAVSIVASTSGTLASSFINDAINGTDEYNDVAVSLDVAAASLVKGETVEVQITYNATAPVIRHSFSFFSGREIM